MNWTNPPATEGQTGQEGRPGYQIPQPYPGDTIGTLSQPPGGGHEIKIDRSAWFDPRVPHADAQLYTLTIGGETIQLLPLKNWGQLDHFKWTVRGRLPGEPPGLEVAPDHVRIAGETISIKDPGGCAKLERLFNEWLALERQTLELATHRSRAHPVASAQVALLTQPQHTHFRVEPDKRGQVHVLALQGKEVLASVGLTQAGFTSLIHQGLMRKPRSLTTGALHDWVELDGVLCSFERGHNDAARLEQLLNEKYVPSAALGQGREIVIYQNAASATGFDIQFPVTIAGVVENRRHHLGDQALALLHDPERCGLLHTGLIIKLIPPNLIFKQRTPDGGEQYLPRAPRHVVTVTDEDGTQAALDLSQPLNILHLSAAELIAVFNHSAINRHTQAASAAPANVVQPAVTSPKPVSAPPEAHSERAGAAHCDPPNRRLTHVIAPPKLAELAAQKGSDHKVSAQIHSAPTVAQAAVKPPPPHPMAPDNIRPLPNLWLNDLLAQPQLEHDWFAHVVYTKLAERFGNSSEGQFGTHGCWFITLNESENLHDPDFKGIFLTEKGGLGFLNQQQLVRFYNGVAFLGTFTSTIEGIQIGLAAVGLDSSERLVFVLTDNYRERFDIPEMTLVHLLQRMRNYGVSVLGVSEVLTSREPITVLWTAPAAQANLEEPVVLEYTLGMTVRKATVSAL